MKKTFAIKILSGTIVHEYNATIERDVLMPLIAKHNE